MRHSKFQLSPDPAPRSEEHTSELQSQSNLVCRLLLEKKKNIKSVLLYAGAYEVQSLWPYVSSVCRTREARMSSAAYLETPLPPRHTAHLQHTRDPTC